MLILEHISRTNPNILADMAKHYSKPKGFVGRNLCYAILYNNTYYGSVAGGSATLHLPGRDEFFGGIDSVNKLNCIINNIFYHIEKVDGKYPTRNFTQYVLNEFCIRVSRDWEDRYGDKPVGFESLVELPRTGELYTRCGWTQVGITKGFTCKRVGGMGHYAKDIYTGLRVWDYTHLRPKLVFCKKIETIGGIDIL